MKLASDFSQFFITRKRITSCRIVLPQTTRKIAPVTTVLTKDRSGRVTPSARCCTQFAASLTRQRVFSHHVTWSERERAFWPLYPRKNFIITAVKKLNEVAAVLQLRENPSNVTVTDVVMRPQVHVGSHHFTSFSVRRRVFCSKD